MVSLWYISFIPKCLGSGGYIKKISNRCRLVLFLVFICGIHIYDLVINDLVRSITEMYFCPVRNAYIWTICNIWIAQKIAHYWSTVAQSYSVQKPHEAKPFSAIPKPYHTLTNSVNWAPSSTRFEQYFLKLRKYIWAQDMKTFRCYCSKCAKRVFIWHLH